MMILQVLANLILLIIGRHQREWELFWTRVPKECSLWQLASRTLLQSLQHIQVIPIYLLM